MAPEKIRILLCTRVLLFCAGCIEPDLPQNPDTTIPPATVTTTHMQPPSVNPTASSQQIPMFNTTVSLVATSSEPRFLNPLRLKQAFLFGNGTRWSSEGAITRIWINDTSRWYNPEELQYDTRVAPEGKNICSYLSLWSTAEPNGLRSRPREISMLSVIMLSSIPIHYIRYP